MGSSPHTRGALLLFSQGQIAPKDHPRIRGEHLYTFGPSYMRLGIIPAYAGSTAVLVMSLSSNPGSSPHTRGALADIARVMEKRRDHPRIRGEHWPISHA